MQMKFRSKQARARIALKKSLAESADAREEHRAANRLQGQLRGRKARAEARERAQRRVAVLRQVSLRRDASNAAKMSFLSSNLIGGSRGSKLSVPHQRFHGEHSDKYIIRGTIRGV